MDEKDELRLYRHFAVGLLDELEKARVTKLYANIQENPYIYIHHQDGTPAEGIKPLGMMIRAMLALHSTDPTGWHLKQLRILVGKCTRSIKGLLQEKEMAERSNGRIGNANCWAIKPLEDLMEKTIKEIHDVERGLIWIECEKLDKEKGPGDESPDPSIDQASQDPA